MSITNSNPIAGNPIVAYGGGAESIEERVDSLETKTSRLSTQGTVFSGANIEFTPTSGSNIGGYIDFHYNGSTADYTSRIIESYSGRINISAPNGLELNGVNFMEYGSNSNGHYVKFANGLMICWHTMSVETNITTSWGSWYESSSGVQWTYPQAFTSNPGLSVSRYRGVAATIEFANNGDYTHTPSIYLTRPNTASGTSVLSFLAIGSWN